MSEGSVPESADGTDVVVTAILDTVVARLVDPRARRRHAMSCAIDQVLDDPRYGRIGVNVWHALGVLSGSTPWGAYPGHAPPDIQSGVGTVGNTYMFARPQKSIVRGPFVAWPTPAWFVTHRRSAQAIRRIFEVQCSLSCTKLRAVLWAAPRPRDAATPRW
jgi:hypothetical protein